MELNIEQATAFADKFAVTVENAFIAHTGEHMDHDAAYAIAEALAGAALSQQEPDSYRVITSDGVSALFDAPINVTFWREKMGHTVLPLFAASPMPVNIAQSIHYPDCWDAATYPTVESALAEIGAFKCSECTAPAQLQHSDDVAVDRFAVAMKEKMTVSRANGRSGWDDHGRCTNQSLSDMLIAHVTKGDPIDVANFAMMIHQRGERIAASAKHKSSLATELREYASNSGYSHNDYADVLRAGADAIERLEALKYSEAPTQTVGESTTGDKYRAELYDEVWVLARKYGFANVTMAIDAAVKTKLVPLSDDQIKSIAHDQKHWGAAHGSEDLDGGPDLVIDPVKFARAILATQEAK
ncbi:hypothetical protein [Glaciimonas sp. PCH181]|uniref:hypothetical protein n=1 Tax=Glaciimonas sp. PCH181 TaxID=2133943 RepID=UPI00191BED7E|nr:hypothetical protein [Glaciimonas sp. PCH181]